eukprot:1142307-Pelagomonas_calceolata.AAC.3
MIAGTVKRVGGWEVQSYYIHKCTRTHTHSLQATSTGPGGFEAAELLTGPPQAETAGFGVGDFGGGFAPAPVPAQVPPPAGRLAAKIDTLLCQKCQASCVCMCVCQYKKTCAETRVQGSLESWKAESRPLLLSSAVWCKCVD